MSKTEYTQDSERSILKLALMGLEARPYSASQFFMVFDTRAAASQWDQWPALGMVTRVSGASIHFQVSLSAPGSRAVSFKPWNMSTGIFTLGAGGPSLV